MTDKEPRSRRICLLCGCLYGSHIDVGCIKILNSKDPRIECPCDQFVGTLDDLKIYEERKERRLNTLIEREPEKIQIAVKHTKFPKFY